MGSRSPRRRVAALALTESMPEAVASCSSALGCAGELPAPPLQPGNNASICWTHPTPPKGPLLREEPQNLRGEFYQPRLSGAPSSNYGEEDEITRRLQTELAFILQFIWQSVILSTIPILHLFFFFF